MSCVHRTTVTRERRRNDYHMTKRGFEPLKTKLDNVELDALIADLGWLRRSMKAPHSAAPMDDDARKGNVCRPLGVARSRRAADACCPCFTADLGWLNFGLVVTEQADALAAALTASTKTRCPDDDRFWES